MDIEIKLGYDSPKEVLALFSEYMEMLIAGDSTFKKYLEILESRGTVLFDSRLDCL